VDERWALVPKEREAGVDGAASERRVGIEVGQVAHQQSAVHPPPRDLNAWIDEPFAAPPDPQASPQAELAFA
jgi:hypothetical protein